jgi:hypothetical protein
MISGIAENSDFSFPNPEDYYLSEFGNTTSDGRR